MDYRELVNLGLSEKEAKVYLAALQLGKAPVAKIAQKAEVNRATTYVQIKSLMAKGLMSSYEEGKKTYYFAESPEKLSLLFREQAMAIQRKQEYLDKILPELRSLKAPEQNKPIIRYFEGKEGLRAVSEEFFLTKHTEPARMIYSVDLLNKVFSEAEKKQIRQRRFKNKTQNKVIYSFEKGELTNDALSERKKIPANKFPIEADIAIFDNKIRIATMKNKLTGIVIENKEIATTLKSLFDLAWKGIDLIKKEKSQKNKGLKK